MAWFQKSVAGLVAGGVRKAARGEYDLAITDFSAAIQLLEPDDLFEYVEVFTCRADAYADDGQYDNALADYDKAIKNARSIMNSTGHLWRFSPSALFCGRGRSYLAKGDYDRAIADFNESIHHDKYSDAARAARGRAYYVKKDYDRAIADFRQLVGDDPTSIYNKRLAEVYAAHGFAYAS
jgi:tetratricopeptide (TPR) repeat protein